MTVTLAQIWRHPIKAHGAEALDQVEVVAGHTLPWDRTWAVTHEAAKTDGSAWAKCANFSRGAKAPALMAISARLDDDGSTITLSHPNRTPLTFRPDNSDDLPAFLEWTRPLMPADRAASTGIVRVEGRGMTDTDFPSISLANLASLKDLSAKTGQNLDPRRFRANLWVDGLAPWAEFDWVGKTITIDGTAFRVVEPIERCLATAANPATGERDANTLGALEAGWGHRDFGIFLNALDDGQIAIGARVDIG